MKQFAHSLFLIAMLCSPIPAFAADFYMAGSIGQARTNISKSDIDNIVIEGGATNVNSTVDNTDTAYKLLLGYQFNPYLGIEGGYVDLGKTTYAATATQGNATLAWKAKGWLLSAVGTLPVNDSFGVFAKLGAFHSEVSWNLAATGSIDANEAWSGTKWKAAYGVGASYNLNKQVGFRLEYEVFDKLGDVNKDKVDFISAGVVYKF